VIVGFAVRIQYVAAAMLLQALPSLIGGLALWAAWTFGRRLRGIGGDRTGLIGAQVAAVTAPLVLGLLEYTQKAVEGDAWSLRGISLAAGLLAVAAAMVVLATLLAARFLPGKDRPGSEPFRLFARAGVLVCALAAAVLLGGTAFNSSRNAAAERPNVLFVSLDSVRADDWERFLETSAGPWLRDFVGSSRGYSRAYTTWSHSLPSHASMLTGLYPLQHGARITRRPPREDVGSPLAPGAHRLTLTMAGNGYETAYFGSNAWLGPPYGLEVGFETFVNHGKALKLGVFSPVMALSATVAGRYLHYVDKVFGGLHPTTRIFTGWLGRRDSSRPFFCLLHFIDMHYPHDPPRETFSQSAAGAFAEFRGSRLRKMYDNGEIGPDRLPEAIEQLHRLSVGQLTEVEKFIIPALATLEERGLLDRTLVVLTSDHGDDLYEKTGEYGHVDVYEGVMRVPLAIRIPADGEGSTHSELASLVDLAPTALRYAGLTPPEGLPGIDLLDEASLARRSGEGLLLEGADPGTEGWNRAWVRGDYKIIERAEGGRELFNLADDPGEKNDLAAARPGIAAELAGQLEAAITSMQAAESQPVNTEDLPEHVIEQLRALGYLE
jgi:arylsulfatase A-like enzyme